MHRLGLPSLGAHADTRTRTLDLADWPQFRGPTGHGHAWRKASDRVGQKKNVAWQRNCRGNGLVVAGHRRGQDLFDNRGAAGEWGEAGISRCARSVSMPAPARSTGTRKSSSPRKRKRARCTRRTATPARRRRSSGERTVRPLRPHGHRLPRSQDGKVLWKRTGLRVQPGPRQRRLAHSASMTGSSSVCDGGDKQFVVALDTKDGKIAWQTPRNVDAAQELLVQHAAADRRGRQETDVIGRQRRGDGPTIAKTGKRDLAGQLRRLLGRPAAGLWPRPRLPLHRLRQRRLCWRSGPTARAMSPRLTSPGR